MGAKSDRIKRLMYILERSSGWVSSSVLARMLSTSERTIRNYISEVNAVETHIESSKDGYRLAQKGLIHENAKTAHESQCIAKPPVSDAWKRPAADQKNITESRRDYTLVRLVNSADPVSTFDLANELYISESTLANSVLPRVRQLLAQFDITLVTHDFRMTLKGEEHNKRRLLGHIATQDANGYFTSTTTLQGMFPHFDVESILSHLTEICQRSELLINNYALNNLLIHILVIIIRLKSNNELDARADFIDSNELIKSFKQRDNILRCANEFAQYFETEFGCTIPKYDYQQIILLIALSVERYSYDELSYDKLSTLMDQPFLETVSALAEKTTARYNLPPFDEAFMLQLILHMYNAYQRATYHVSYPNPLAAQIKSDYAPVYDMAVYFAHRFSTTMDIEISENEIAFIAFHIGAYLERSAAPDDKATCIVIVEQYHDFARQLVNDLESALSEELTIIAVMSCDGYLTSHPESDLVITTVDVPVSHGLKILIGPILTKQNLRKIRDKMADVLEEKRRGQAYRFLKTVLRPELFVRNLALNGGPDAYIDYLGGLALEYGFATQRFIDDVHLRERVSSTAFTDSLAIPHSIDTYAKRSFIAALHSDAAIPWGRHGVHFVLLIGIAQDEMSYFRDVLDIVIELFSSVDETMRLMQTDTFDEFVRAFTRKIR